MSLEVNAHVANGLAPFPIDPYYVPNLPKYAETACLSDAENAPWTNRVPRHEPWARTMEGDTEGANSMNNECDYNTHHNPQFDDSTEDSAQKIGKIEGTDVIDRGQLWRR